MVMQNHSEPQKPWAVLATSWSWGKAMAIKVLAGMLFLGLWEASAQAGQSLTLSWNENPDSDVGGYKIYYGGESHLYTNVVDIGLVTRATTTNLAEGVTYYFAVTAYNRSGVESDFSDEFSYLVPIAVNEVRMSVAAGGQVTLSVTGPAGSTYDIQATEDLKTWALIGTGITGVEGLFDFRDTNAALFSKRFYRTVEVQP